MVLGGSATAQTTWQAGAAADLGYSRTTGTSAVTANRTYSDVRPSLALQFGSPRMVWRAACLFAGSITLRGEDPHSYSNQAELSLAAALTPRSTLSLHGAVTQGSTAFQISQRSADAGQPGFRAPGNPEQVSAALGESYVWEASARSRLQQGVTASLSAPQDSLGHYSAEITGSLGLDRSFGSDSIGAELTSRASLLRPLTAQSGRYVSNTNALRGRWSRDFGRRWNGQLTAGVEQVLTFAGSYPLAVLPSGSLNINYFHGGAAGSTAAAGSIGFHHGTMSDLQTGTMSVSDDVFLRGSIGFGATGRTRLSASAGFLSARPLGQSDARAAPGTGKAVQGDVGFVMGLSDALFATARYSAAYQFAQTAGLEPSLVHVVLVGLTATYGDTRRAAPVPTQGSRVDGGDAVGFPGSDVAR